MPKHFLFTTVGRTDIKICLHNGEKENIYEIDSNDMLAFHQWLQENQAKIDFDSEPNDFGETDGRQIARFAKGAFSITDRDTQKITTLTPLDSKITLRYPKLERVIKQLQRDKPLSGAVVYYTDRSPLDKQEPFFAGEIIKNWLKKQLNTECIVSVNCIEDAKNFPNLEGTGRDYPLRRAVAKRIEEPLRMLANHDANAVAIISDAGGIPAMKLVLRAAARFFFPHSKQVYFFLDTERSGSETLECSLRESIEESYRTRTICSELLQKGAITEAYYAAQHLKDDPEDKKWIGILKLLRDLFAGENRPTNQNAKIPEALRQATVHDNKIFCPRCLLIALRIEAMLVSKRYIEAIMLTYTFFEVSRVDLLSFLAFTQGNCNENSVHEELNARFRKNFLTLSDTHKQTLEQKGGLHIVGDWFEYYFDKSFNNGNTTYGAVERYWFKILESELGGNACLKAIRDYKKKLEDKPKPLSQSQKCNIAVKKMRNSLTHSMPSSKEIQTIPTVCVASGLWQQQNGSYTFTFLQTGQPAANVLKIFGINDPATLYKNLIQEGVEAMWNHIIE